MTTAVRGEVAVFDIGGTNTKFAVFNSKREILSKEVVKTPSSYDELLSLIREKKINRVDVVVLGLPAVIDYSNYKVIYAPNIDYLTNKDLVRDLNLENVLIENDANLAALGEYHTFWKDSSSMLMVTIGTGVGGGLILDGKLLKSKFSVAEIGHINVENDGRVCGCGNRGCLEAYCGKKGILTTYEILGGAKYNSINKIYAEAKQGKLIASLTFRQFAHYLSIGLVSALNVVYVENIVIGGGISHFGDIFFKDLIKFFNSKIYPPYKKSVIISIANLKNDAALFGGFYYAKESNFLLDNNSTNHSK
ncbi:ROK family protein [Deferribacter autotrophicus]|uniref:ROK family protein n=1 Tax=Deferribacter autotrophicus TaxID=500465 RepID=UPI00165DFDF6|nr:ROK family protein [Deferribacter autotrophicus]